MSPRPESKSLSERIRSLIEEVGEDRRLIPSADELTAIDHLPHRLYLILEEAMTCAIVTGITTGYNQRDNDLKIEAVRADAKWQLG